MSQNSCSFYQTINDFRFPASFKRENIDFALNYKPTDRDIFVVTFPKCGTTWAKQIISLILNDGIPHENEIDLLMKSYIEMRGSDCINNTFEKNIIKTHLSFELMPYSESAKYLLVFRNPKDACLSFYHYLKKLFENRYQFEFNEFFDKWITGDIPYGDYFQHTLTFWSHRFDQNFDFMVYEHMKNDSKEAVLKIGKFLGEKYENKLKENNELLLNKVLEYSTVEYMKPALKFNPLVRKGIVGDWKSQFNEAQSDLVDEKVENLFNGTGLEMLWINDMKW